MCRRYNSTPVTDVRDETEGFGVGDEAAIGDAETPRSCGRVAVNDAGADDVRFY